MNYRIPGPYRGYNAHRGRRLKIIAALVGVCLLGASAFLLLQDYLVFSPDGVRLELPFFGLDKKSGKAPKKEETPPLKVETGGSEKNGTEPQSNAAEPEQTAPEKPAGNSDSLILNAVCADYAKLADREYRRSLMSLSGVNAVIVDLKLADGNVTYLSKAASPDAQKKASDSVSDAIKEFSENGLRVIGRISAFRDNAAPRTVMRSSAIRTGSGATWLDYNYYGWLDPYKKSSAEYLGALSKEAEELGCSEVMFTNFCFPVSGKTSLIKYSGEDGKDRETAIGEALAAIRAAVGDKMEISVMAESAAAINGVDKNSGQDVKELLSSGRVFFDASKVTVGAEKWDEISAGSFSDGKIVPVFGASNNARPLAGLAAETLKQCGFVLASDTGEYSATNFISGN